MRLDRRAIKEIIEELKRDAATYFPGRSVDRIDLQEIIPRPYSQLAHVRIRFSDGQDHAYIKLYRHPDLPFSHNIDSAQREHDAHARLYEVFQGDDDCGVVRPIALFAERGGWVMDAIDGRTLDYELSRKGNRFADRQAKRELRQSARLAGAWLRRLHDEIRGDETAALEDCKVMAEIDRLIGECPALNDAERRHATICAKSLARQVGSQHLALVGQHGECFAPHHIFVSQGRLLVFDITGIKYGPPYEDLSNLWVGLEAMRKYPIFSGQEVRRLQDAYLEGYGSAENGFLDAAFSLYKLKNMIKLLNSWSRPSKVGWRNRLRQQIGVRFAKAWIAEQARD